MKKQDFLSQFFIDGISIGKGAGPPSARRLPPPSGYAYDCNVNAICDIKILSVFLLVCPFVHVKATNGFISYDHTKYVISLVKVKILLNSSSNLKL